MKNKKFVVNPDDFNYVHGYLLRCFNSLGWLGPNNFSASMEIKDLNDHVELTKWCVKYLDHAQWKRLKNSLRANRKRSSDKAKKIEPNVNITISKKAWLILRDLSKSKKLNYSEFIIEHHKQDWVDLPTEK